MFVEKFNPLLWEVVDAKSGKARPNRSQTLNDQALTEGRFVPTGDQFPMSDVKYLRVRIDQVDPRHLELTLNKRLSNAVEGGTLSRAEADAIRERVLGYRSQSSAENPIPLIAVGAMLSQFIAEEEES